MRIARDLGHTITAIADPSEAAIETMLGIAGDPAPRTFADADDLFAEPKLADVALVSTQDAQHFGHASAALRAGYDVLLEKPAAQSSEEVEELARLADENGCKLLLCFVLRYTPFYRTMKRAIDDGRIGEVISIQAAEGVGPFHNAHSFVRGHWAQTKDSTPMIIAKCCHDTDLMTWFAGSPCTAVSSFAEISHFRPDKAPEGSTDRCIDGCPHAGTCLYDANQYLTTQRRWLGMVRPDAEKMTDDDVREWLKTSDWGRCAYKCGQDTPDHQVVSMRFENGITADLTMTAFDTGRRTRIYGTKGILEGAIHADGREPWVECRPHTGGIEEIPIEEQETGGYAGHGGGDFGLIHALPALLAEATSDFIEGHRIGFAAAQSADEGRTVELTRG
ncbi:putative oxidoreductase YteT [Haloferula helveola]